MYRWSTVQMEQPIRFVGGMMSHFLLIAFIFSGKVAIREERAGWLRFDEKGESLKYSSRRVD